MQVTCSEGQRHLCHSTAASRQASSEDMRYPEHEAQRGCLWSATCDPSLLQLPPPSSLFLRAARPTVVFKYLQILMQRQLCMLAASKAGSLSPQVPAGHVLVREQAVVAAAPDIQSAQPRPFNT